MACKHACGAQCAVGTGCRGGGGLCDGGCPCLQLVGAQGMDTGPAPLRDHSGLQSLSRPLSLSINAGNNPRPSSKEWERAGEIAKAKTLFELGLQRMGACVRGQPAPGGLGGTDIRTSTDPGRPWGLTGSQRQICKHKRELGREPVPGRRLSRRAGWGDRQEATKQQHKQEAGPLVTGWGPARAGKSRGGGGGWGEEGRMGVGRGTAS